ncbi:MAG: hypothetical protein ACR2I2_10250 [Bryobacteraceae bacterium]
MSGLGFRLSYRKLEEGMWFPVDHESDFTARVFFRYRRRVSLAPRNSGFRKTEVQSPVAFQE